MGLRVLLVDADVQPSLSKYFPLAAAQPAAGLTEVILRGEVTAACITATVFPNLDIVVSDDPEGHLPNWLLNRIDRGFRLRFALQAAVVANAWRLRPDRHAGRHRPSAGRGPHGCRHPRLADHAGGSLRARVQGRHDGTARPAGAGQRPRRHARDR